MKCTNVHIISPQVVALLLTKTSSELYERIPTLRCRQDSNLYRDDTRVKNGKTNSSNQASLPIPPKAMMQSLQGKHEKREPPNDRLSHAKRVGNRNNGRALPTLKQAKEPSTQTIYAKAPYAKLSQRYFEMNPQQFRKLRIDWYVFNRITDMPTSQTNTQLYSCAGGSV